MRLTGRGGIDRVPAAQESRHTQLTGGGMASQRRYLVPVTRPGTGIALFESTLRHATGLDA